MGNVPRVCHLITTWYKRAGCSRRTMHILKGLKNCGYEIDLLIGQEASVDFQKEAEKEGIKTWRVPGLQKSISPHRDLQALFALRRQFILRRYDLVHTHLSKAGILGRLAARWAGIRVIMHTVHGPSFPDSLSKWRRKFYQGLEKWAARHTNAIVYVGDELRRQYLDAGVGRESISYVIHTGQDFDRYLNAAAQTPGERRDRRAQLHLSGEDLIVGYVARIVPGKGHVYAIQAAQELTAKFPRLRFLFIGEAHVPFEQEYKLALLSEVAQRKLQDRVIFLTHQEDIQNYYAILDIFIMPSLYEGLPNVILEAAVMGVPVLSYDLTGVREILKGKASIVPKGDVGAFGRKLEETILKLKSNECLSLSLEERQALAKRWSIEAMLEAKMRLYRRFLG